MTPLRFQSRRLRILVALLLFAACSTESDAPPTARELFECTEAIFRPTPRGATLHWVTRRPLEARVSWGHRADELTHAEELECDGPTELELDGLEPGREAFFRLEARPRGGSRYLERPLRSFQTGRSPQESYRIGLIADTHVQNLGKIKGSKRNLRSTVRRCLDDALDFVVFLGDEVLIHYYTDQPGDIDQAVAKQRWLEWRQLYTPLLEEVPSFLVLGNHEGEAGFYESVLLGGEATYPRRWGTVARKRYLLNPLPSSYPEGGEDEGWTEAAGPGSTPESAALNRSPLQNYFAWTWGSALFVVLDVHRYAKGRGSTVTGEVAGTEVNVEVEDWSLGPEQLAWFERTLASSAAPHKIVLAHHLAGGWGYGLEGRDPSAPYKYGRGGARYARRGEQDRITTLMEQHGARFFFYGHDHIFAHQAAENVEFVCCGRPTFLQPRWWDAPGWLEAYGTRQAGALPGFLATIGYVRLTIDPERVVIEYVDSQSAVGAAETAGSGTGKVVYRWESSSPSPTVEMVR